jgi:hypothetical protein
MQVSASTHIYIVAKSQMSFVPLNAIFCKVVSTDRGSLQNPMRGRATYLCTNSSSPRRLGSASRNHSWTWDRITRHSTMNVDLNSGVAGLVHAWDFDSCRAIAPTARNGELV